MQDLISRQAAIDAVKEYFKFSPHEGRQCAEAIERVPSAQPRKGKWIKDRDGIYHCSCCNTDYLMYEWAMKDTHYCPNCGCRMEEGDSE